MSNFSLFGEQVAASSSKLGHFVDLLAEGTVAGTTCAKCGKFYFPPRAHCNVCLSKTMNWTPIDGKCKIIAFSERRGGGGHGHGSSHQSDARREFFALAEIVEGPRVVAKISKDSNLPSEGAEAMLKAVKLDEGRVSYELFV